MLVFALRKIAALLSYVRKSLLLTQKNGERVQVLGSLVLLLAHKDLWILFIVIELH
jgi:hypothetical protein